MVTADVQQQRKLDQQCTRCGVAVEDGSQLCPLHLEDYRRRKRESNRKSRRRWRRLGLCTRCGGERPAGRLICLACVVRNNKTRKEHRIRSDAKAARIAAATVVHDDGRQRYHGQRKRGNQPHLQLDEQDLGYARDMLDRGEAGLRLYETSEVQSLPRIQREDVKSAANHELNRALGHIEDVLERRGYFRGHTQSKHGRRDGE